MVARLTRFLATRGPWGILLLALIDSAGVPAAIGVDALVILVAVKNPALAPHAVASGVAGSTAGSLALYYAARSGGRDWVSQQAPEGRTGRLRQWFHRYGLATVFIPALVPIPMPMKAFVLLAGAFGIPLFSFLGCVLLARILRYGGEAYLGVRMGDDAGHYLLEHGWRIAAMVAALVAALCMLVWWSGR